MRLVCASAVAAIVLISGCGNDSSQEGSNPASSNTGEVVTQKNSGHEGANLPKQGNSEDGQAPVCHMADIDTSSGPITVRLPCRADLHLGNLGAAKVVQDGEHCLDIKYSLKGQTSTRVFCPRKLGRRDPRSPG